MKEKIINYVDGLFVDAELTIDNAEFKNELMNDTISYFDDLVANGQSEQDAFRLAIHKIGDVSHLITKKKGEENVRIGSETEDFNGFSKDQKSDEEKVFKSNSSVGNQVSKNEGKSALVPSIMLAVAIALYIFSVIPCIVFEGRTFGVVLMFIFVGVATALIILRGAFTNKISTENGMADVKVSMAKKHKKGALKPTFKIIKGIVDAVLFTGSVFVYIVLSLSFGAWHVAWLVFIIAAAVSEIIEGIFQLAGGAYDED